MIFVDGHDENGEHIGYILAEPSDFPIQRNGNILSLPDNLNIWEWEVLPRLTEDEFRELMEHHNLNMRKLIAEVELENVNRKLAEWKWSD